MIEKTAEEQAASPPGMRVAFVHAAALCWNFFRYYLQVRAKQAGVAFVDKPVATVDEQIAVIERLLLEETAVLLVRPMASDHAGLLAVLRKAQAQGVHLVAIDGMPGGGLDMCSVTVDNFGGQAALAAYAFERLKGRGKIAYLQGDLRTEAGDLRNKGLHSVLARYPGIELAYASAYDWLSAAFSFQQGVRMGWAALQAHPDLDAIISATDEGALGVCAVIDEMGLRGKVMVTGFDGMPEGITALSSGALEVTACQPLEAMAQQAFDLALGLATGRIANVAHCVHPVDLATRETLGEAALRALCVFPEVTEELNKRGIEQKNSAAFLEVVLDNMPALLVVKDAKDLRYVRVNKAREAWMNVPRERQVGKTAFDFFAPEAAARYQAEDRAILDRGETFEIVEEEVVIGDSESRYTRTRKIPIFGADGKPESLMIISEDVSRQKRAERALARHTEALERTNHELKRNYEKLLQAEKMAGLGALVAGVAHELNTPIGNAVLAVSTFADHTRKIAEKNGVGLTRAMLAGYLADAGAGLDIVERNLRRAAELIQSFRQIAADQTSSQARSFFLDTLVAETLLTLSPSLKKAPVEIRRDIPAGLRMDSFPGPLEQVLMNLINNAVIHAFEGRSTGVITITAKTPEAGWVELSVEDDGKGIEPDRLRRIYDPFYTTKLGSGGSGLGLSISRNIVTKVLGGSLDVNSTPGRGTRFVMRLPLQAGEKHV